jgi:DNA-directed RNA polymerase subunit RPC12/RpoP
LGTDEIPLLHEPSKLIEARATRVYAGAGTSMQGIYVGGGQSTSVQSLKELDSGTLTLTTKRLIFTGSMESRVVNVKDVVSVNFFADAIEISTVRKAKRQVYLVRNPMMWGSLLLTVAKGGLSFSKKAPCGGEVRESAQLPQPESEPSTDIRFNCPRCGQHLCVEQSGAGMAVNCPNCNEQIEVPHTTAASQ